METTDKTLDLTVSNYGTARQLHYDLVILPWGATEAHGLHLPYLTDSILSHDIALDAARLALQRHGVRCMVMPPVTLGSHNPGQRTLPFCIHARYETQRAILGDIVASLHVQGQRRLLIVNGHGGNNFKNMIRDLAVDYPDFLIATSEWFKMVAPKDYFSIVGDHADEVETSVMMHYHPDWVNLAEAGSGDSRAFRPDALRDHSVWMPRNWGKVTVDTGIGDARQSTAEKGRRFAEAVAVKYAEFLFQFASARSEDDLYE